MPPTYSQYFHDNDEDNDESDDDASSNGDDDELHLFQAEDDMEQSFVRMDHGFICCR